MKPATVGEGTREGSWARPRRLLRPPVLSWILAEADKHFDKHSSPNFETPVDCKGNLIHMSPIHLYLTHQHVVL